VIPLLFGAACRLIASAYLIGSQVWSAYFLRRRACSSSDRKYDSFEKMYQGRAGEKVDSYRVENQDGREAIAAASAPFSFCSKDAHSDYLGGIARFVILVFSFDRNKWENIFVKARSERRNKSGDRCESDPSNAHWIAADGSELLSS
jgi:hypothetical protein